MATITDTHKINPNDLLVDLNVREDLRVDKDLIASIKDLGVLQPIVAVQTAEGLRVRYGHRRTRAAVEAGLDTVPVVVVQAENEGDAETVERLLSQYAENEQRAGLTTGEKIGVTQQLSLLGVSPAQIAKRTRAKRADVDASLQVAASDLATKATDRYDLTLDQAATLAEFEDDTDTVTALVAAAKTGQFEHVASRARQARAEAEAKKPVIEQLTAEGIEIIDRPTYYDTATDLSSLVDSQGDALDPDAHQTCPGHAVYLCEREVYSDPDGTEIPYDTWGGFVWPEGTEPENEDQEQARIDALTVTYQWRPAAACTDPSEHGHLTMDQWYSRRSKPVPAAEQTEAEREAAKAARRTVIENNKAWKAARDVRREWVKTYLTRKTLPAQAGNFIARALTADARLIDDTDACRIAADWFGVEPATYGRSDDLTRLGDEASDKRALVITLGVILAAYEQDAGDGAWRANGQHSPTGRYLRFLADLGYTLSDVEDYAASDQTV